MEYMDFM